MAAEQNSHPPYLTKNIAILRRNARLSKKDMAKLLHISVHSLNEMERGRIPPRMSFEVLLHIHQHFGILPNTVLFEPLDQ